MIVSIDYVFLFLKEGYTYMVIVDNPFNIYLTIVMHDKIYEELNVKSVYESYDRGA